MSKRGIFAFIILAIMLASMSLASADVLTDCLKQVKGATYASGIQGLNDAEAKQVVTCVGQANYAIEIGCLKQVMGVPYPANLEDEHVSKQDLVQIGICAGQRMGATPSQQECISRLVTSKTFNDVQIADCMKPGATAEGNLNAVQGCLKGLVPLEAAGMDVSAQKAECQKLVSQPTENSAGTTKPVESTYPRTEEWTFDVVLDKPYWKAFGAANIKSPRSADMSCDFTDELNADCVARNLDLYSYTPDKCSLNIGFHVDFSDGNAKISGCEKITSDFSEADLIKAIEANPSRGLVSKEGLALLASITGTQQEKRAQIMQIESEADQSWKMEEIRRTLSVASEISQKPVAAPKIIVLNIPGMGGGQLAPPGSVTNANDQLIDDFTSGILTIPESLAAKAMPLADLKNLIALENAKDLPGEMAKLNEAQKSGIISALGLKGRDCKSLSIVSCAGKGKLDSSRFLESGVLGATPLTNLLGKAVNWGVSKLTFGYVQNIPLVTDAPLSILGKNAPKSASGVVQFKLVNREEKIDTQLNSKQVQITRINPPKMAWTAKKGASAVPAGTEVQPAAPGIVKKPYDYMDASDDIIAKCNSDANSPYNGKEWKDLTISQRRTCYNKYAIPQSAWLAKIASALNAIKNVLTGAGGTSAGTGPTATVTPGETPAKPGVSASIAPPVVPQTPVAIVPKTPLQAALEKAPVEVQDAAKALGIMAEPAASGTTGGTPSAISPGGQALGGAGPSQGAADKLPGQNTIGGGGGGGAGALCNESWTCLTTPCENGKQTKLCSDKNKCGKRESTTEELKCTPDPSTCEPQWQCTEGDCIFEQKTTTCVDLGPCKKDTTETTSECAAIPESICGDGLCDYFETTATCPSDCQQKAPTPTRSPMEKAATIFLIILLVALGALSWIYFRPKDEEIEAKSE